MGAGPRDDELVLRDGGTDLTATETLTKTLRGGNSHINPLSVLVLIPQAAGTDNIVVTVRFTDTGKQITITHTTAHISATDSVPDTYEFPLPVTDAESLEVVLTVSGTENWGAVQVWLERVGGSGAKTPDGL